MKNVAAYRTFGLITIIAIYFLIWVGGVVRSTGSGMGCPDWPKCFGQYIPPTDISQLPPDYKTRFAVQGKEIADFNPVKTWIEYINRLIGALIGLFVLATAFFSFSYWNRGKRYITFLSVLAVFLVGFQAWLGSIVVATDLHEGMITLHMVMALVIVGILIFTVAKARLEQQPAAWGVPSWVYKRLSLVLVACLSLGLVQIILGTQVREMVDVVAKKMGENLRAEWIDQLGLSFYIHRSFSLLILGLHLYLVKILIASRSIAAANAGKWLLGLIVVAILTGVVLAYLAMPAFVQPLHLLLGTIMFGLQFWIFVKIHSIGKG
ncbi:COX15/CtaA family protein [Hugenholtzia roseola]|uniref:COX15/CtaA family protein n=1 Tax=Hugenholtzia roseola TaxID=1002 RepID=UPI0003FC4F5B|nr:COX15/CtaA family protein [Hugenholtzia roseola]